MLKWFRAFFAEIRLWRLKRKLWMRCELSQEDERIVPALRLVLGESPTPEQKADFLLETLTHMSKPGAWNLGMQGNLKKPIDLLSARIEGRLPPPIGFVGFCRVIELLGKKRVADHIDLYLQMIWPQVEFTDASSYIRQHVALTFAQVDADMSVLPNAQRIIDKTERKMQKLMWMRVRAYQIGCTVAAYGASAEWQAKALAPAKKMLVLLRADPDHGEAYTRMADSLETSIHEVAALAA